MVSFAKGKLDTRVHVSGRDEVAELAEAFNNMAAVLEKNEENRKPEAITSRQILQWKRQCEAELAKRNLQFHDIGHGWTSAPYGLNATGWGKKFEGKIDEELKNALALYNGERKFFHDSPIKTQLCYSNPGVMERVTDFATEYCKNNPNVHYLTFWMSDGGRNHCECEECIKKTPSDHYVDMLNLLDIKLEKAEAEALYAGIFMDTKNFTFKTGHSTFVFGRY